MKFNDVLTLNNEKGPSFDALRLVLSILILAFHSIVVSGGLDYYLSTPMWITSNVLVSMFFSVSGFLVCRSAIRLPLTSFLINRALRIFPALILVILFSIFVIGPIFTTYSLRNYVSDELTRKYLLGIFGIIQYELPGLFRNNPSQSVNQSLWTIPWELLSYVATILLISLKLIKSRKYLFIFAVSLVFAPLLISFGFEQDKIPKFLSIFTTGRGSTPFQAFMLSIVLYVFRSDIPYNKHIAIFCVFVITAISIVGDQHQTLRPILNAFIVFPVVYLSIFIGISKVLNISFYKNSDYSYGTYLFGYPIQQTIILIGPDSQNAFENFFLSLPVVTICAFLSWHLVEQPMLSKKTDLSYLALRKMDHIRQYFLPD